MTNYVVVAGTGRKGTLLFAQRDITYNMKLAQRKRDKATYVRMLKLRSHVNYGIRMESQLGDPCMTLRVETWKNGQKYVVRGLNGKFKAVISK